MKQYCQERIDRIEKCVKEEYVGYTRLEQDTDSEYWTVSGALQALDTVNNIFLYDIKNQIV